MLQRFTLRFVGFLIFFLFLLPILVNAAPVGKITKLEGRVDVLKAGQSTVGNVSPGDNVDVGDIFRAKTNSRAEITFFNKNILRIHPATRIQISQYSDDGTRSDQVMKMDRGKVEAVSSQEFVKKVSSFAEGNKFEVHTPNAAVGIRGSGMTVAFANMATGVFFSTGRGYLYNPNQPGIVQNISAGFVSFIIGTGGLPSRPVPGNVSYVAGPGGGPAPGTGTGTMTVAGPNNIVVQTAIANPINQTLTTTPPPATPNVLVGYVSQISVTGGSPYYNYVKMYDIKFWGSSVNGLPYAWSALIYGDRATGSPHVPAPVSGGSPRTTATLTMTSSTAITPTTGSWTNSVTNGYVPAGGMGALPYNQTATRFDGQASGTYTVSGSRSISTGTASGKAYP